MKIDYAPEVAKIVATIVWAIFVLVSVVYAVGYYQQHKVDIWLQVETVVEAITFPFKMAALYKEDPLDELPVPVHGVAVSEIADTWGAARAEGRTHEGVDIFAARHTPVMAAAPGYVVRVGENRLGGTIVFTVGPGGIRYYYAHLERVAAGVRVGTPVTTDTVIGFVGNSGNAEATGPHLHFGIYNNGPQNPYPFLVDRMQ